MCIWRECEIKRLGGDLVGAKVNGPEMLALHKCLPIKQYTGELHGNAVICRCITVLVLHDARCLSLETYIRCGDRHQHIERRREAAGI